MKKRILVIDDEEFIVQLIMKIVSDNGYDCLTASSLNDAIKIIHSEKLDMVITDIMIPHFGGFDIIDEIKGNEKTKNIPVVVITGMNKDIFMHTVSKAD